MLRSIASICLLFVWACSASAAVIYVHASAAGTNSGSSWTNAFNDLQDAFAASSAGDSLWVAEGTYFPTEGTDRTVSFALPNGRIILGGFAGNESNAEQRNPTAHPCVLSGNIGNGGVDTDNSHRVVTTQNVSAATVLDGFIIRDGHYTDVTTVYSGAGLYNEGGSPAIRRCIFRFNIAGRGAAIAQTQGGNCTLTECSFENNTASGPSTASGGGAVYINSGSMTVRDGLFTGNTGFSGGAIQLGGGLLTLDRCIITNNTANTSGAAIYGAQNDFTLTITNTLIAGNASNGSVSAIYCVSSPNRAHRMRNVTVAHNAFGTGSNASCILNQSSTVSNCIFAGNEETTAVSIGNGLTSNTLIEGINTPSILFVNPGSVGLAPFSALDYNYRLQVFSPAIDYGSASQLLPGFDAMDLDNTERTFGNAPDAGAYEIDYCPFATSIISSNPNGVCVNGTATLSVNTTQPVLWNNGTSTNPRVIDVPGNYSVEIDSAGCLGTASLSVDYYLPLLIIEAPDGTSFCEGNTLVLTAFGPTIVEYAWSNNDFSPSTVVGQQGNYTVLGTDAYGCSSEEAISVSVFPYPSVNITGDLTLCPGETSQLTAAGGNWTSVNWLPTGATTTSTEVDEPGSYSVTVTNSGGCSSTTTAVVTGSELPTPLVVYESGLVSTGSFSEYQWFLNGEPIPGGVQFYWLPEENGVYTVYVTNAAGCGALSPPFTVANISVGETDMGPLRIFPNPGSELLTVLLPSPAPLEVRNAQGRLVHTEYLFGTQKQLSTAAWPAGIYLIRAGDCTGRWVKQ
jgi:hypothetical protein